MDAAHFKRVDTTGANITRNVSMDDARLDGGLVADAMMVGNSLSMQRTRLDGDLMADALQIGKNVDLTDAINPHKTYLNFIQVGGYFDIRGAALGELRL